MKQSPRAEQQAQHSEAKRYGMIPRQRRRLRLTARWLASRFNGSAAVSTTSCAAALLFGTATSWCPVGRCRCQNCRRRSHTDTQPGRSVGNRSSVTHGCQLAMTVQISNSCNVSSVDETLSTNSCTNGQTSLTRDNSWVNEWPLLSDVLFVAVKVRAVANRYACACVV